MGRARGAADTASERATSTAHSNERLAAVATRTVLPVVHLERLHLLAHGRVGHDCCLSVLLLLSRDWWRWSIGVALRLLLLFSEASAGSLVLHCVTAALGALGKLRVGAANARQMAAALALVASMARRRLSAARGFSRRGADFGSRPDTIRSEKTQQNHSLCKYSAQGNVMESDLLVYLNEEEQYH